MTIPETLIVVGGIVAACVFLIGFVVLILRRSMDKPPKKTDHGGDHYHESGLGDDPGTPH